MKRTNRVGYRNIEQWWPRCEKHGYEEPCPACVAVRLEREGSKQ